MQTRTPGQKKTKGALIFVLCIITMLSVLGIGVAQAATYTAEDSFVFDASTGYITAYKGSEQNVNIPETIGNTPVKGIEWGAFSDTDVTQVKLPSTIEKIGAMAFENCTNLTSIEIPEGVTEIAPYAFSGCTNLKTVTLSSSVTSVMLEAFSGCTALNEIVMLDKVSTIEDEVFENHNSSLTIVGMKNSYAETYARNENITFKEYESEDQAAANKVIELINQIGDVTLSSRDAIERAREAYEDLSAAQKALIPSETLNKLVGAENDLKELEDANKPPTTDTETTEDNKKEETNSTDNKAAADEVITLINGIGDVTLDSKTTVESARDAYDKLTDEQKQMIPEEILAKLENAEAELRKLEDTTTTDQPITDQPTTDQPATDDQPTTGQPETGQTTTEQITTGQKEEADKNAAGNTSETKLTLSQEKATLYTKGKRTLTLKAYDSGMQISSGSVQWKSDNSKVAQISNNGKVTAKKKGKATISATYNGVTAKVEITVKKPSLKLKKSKAVLNVNKTYKIRATAKPANKITYKSNNKTVATVTKKGVVKAKKIGKAKITVKANGVKKTFTVTVK